MKEIKIKITKENFKDELERFINNDYPENTKLVFTCSDLKLLNAWCSWCWEERK